MHTPATHYRALLLRTEAQAHSQPCCCFWYEADRDILSTANIWHMLLAVTSNYSVMQLCDLQLFILYHPFFSVCSTSSSLFCRWHVCCWMMQSPTGSIGRAKQSSGSTPWCIDHMVVTPTPSWGATHVMSQQTQRIAARLAETVSA